MVGEKCSNSNVKQLIGAIGLGNCIRTANYKVCAQKQRCPFTLVVGLYGTAPNTFLVLEEEKSNFHISSSSNNLKQLGAAI